MDRYIQAHGRRLFGLCLTLCAHRQDAEDLYQDTWLKALAHFHQYDPNRPFEPWLTRICVNTYRNSLRRLARSPIFQGFRSTTPRSSQCLKDLYMVLYPQKEGSMTPGTRGSKQEWFSCHQFQ